MDILGLYKGNIGEKLGGVGGCSEILGEIGGCGGILGKYWGAYWKDIRFMENKNGICFSGLGFGLVMESHMEKHTEKTICDWQVYRDMRSLGFIITSRAVSREREIGPCYWV